MSEGRAFFDTNILLYMEGVQDEAKKSRAQQVFRERIEDGEVVISTQVVQEFYVRARKVLRSPQQELEERVESLLELPMVRIGPPHIRDAMRIEQQFQISFWDALIVAAAQAAEADVLFTEDLNHGQRYGSVQVRNPFRD